MCRSKQPDFAAGVIRFQKEIFPQKRALFEKLAEGQAPEALFITCSDSRVETQMITQTEPGNLFICRTAGNIVPPHTDATGGVTASIEYAVSVLNVPHIVVCGHTDCGAMKGAVDPDGLSELPHVRRWLSFSAAAVAAARELGEGLSEQERMTILLQENVKLQLRHLKTHPAVATHLARGDLTLHGWVYDIKTGLIKALDATTDAFEPVETFYAS